jgi:hypothetical protein
MAKQEGGQTGIALPKWIGHDIGATGETIVMNGSAVLWWAVAQQEAVDNVRNVWSDIHVPPKGVLIPSPVARPERVH